MGYAASVRRVAATRLLVMPGLGGCRACKSPGPSLGLLPTPLADTPSQSRPSSLCALQSVCGAFFVSGSRRHCRSLADSPPRWRPTRAARSSGRRGIRAEPQGGVRATGSASDRFLMSPSAPGGHRKQGAGCREPPRARERQRTGVPPYSAGRAAGVPPRLRWAGQSAEPRRGACPKRSCLD